MQGSCGYGRTSTFLSTTRIHLEDLELRHTSLLVTVSSFPFDVNSVLLAFIRCSICFICASKEVHRLVKQLVLHFRKLVVKLKI